MLRDCFGHQKPGIVIQIIRNLGPGGDTENLGLGTESPGNPNLKQILRIPPIFYKFAQVIYLILETIARQLQSIDALRIKIFCSQILLLQRMR